LTALALLLFISVAAQGMGGAVIDEGGNAVEGAYVFAFRDGGRAARRPPDFVSRPTGTDGGYVLHLPEGSYVIKARKKVSGERFGPLETHDLTSSGRIAVEIKHGEFLEMDITVLDLKTAAAFSYDERAEMAIIRGRIIPGSGAEAAETFAVAYRDGRGSGFPDFVSALADGDGSYELYVPVGGEVLVGAASGSIDAPHVSGELIRVSVENSITSGIDIVIDEGY